MKIFSLAFALFLISKLLLAQTTPESQVFVTNYAGGTTSGGNFSTEVGTATFSGSPISDLNSFYLGLPAFNLKSAIVSVNSLSNENSVTELVDGVLLRIEDSGNYDTLDTQDQVMSDFSFDPVFLGDYLIVVDSDPSLFVATYFGDVFLWEEANTLELTRDSSISINLTSIPSDSQGEGTVNGTVEEDFEEATGKVDARRRAARRKCGLRKRRTGGREDQNSEPFDLFAYGETNENGEFEFGFIPEGTYRFFVEYPGIPIDQSSFVEFDVGEAGASDNQFTLAATVTEEGIVVELVLGEGQSTTYSVTVYPNPTKNQLYIESPESLFGTEYILTDLNGKILEAGKISARSERQQLLDLSRFDKGTYLIRIIQRKGQNKVQYVRRIVRR
ncbi:MAG: T9SS type A sorting domain-containing protein [Bacteroidota bacterium]